VAVLVVVIGAHLDRVRSDFRSGMSIADISMFNFLKFSAHESSGSGHLIQRVDRTPSMRHSISKSSASRLACEKNRLDESCMWLSVNVFLQ